MMLGSREPPNHGSMIVSRLGLKSDTTVHPLCLVPPRRPFLRLEVGPLRYVLIIGQPTYLRLAPTRTSDVPRLSPHMCAVGREPNMEAALRSDTAAHPIIPNTHTPRERDRERHREAHVLMPSGGICSSSRTNRRTHVPVHVCTHESQRERTCLAASEPAGVWQ